MTLVKEPPAKDRGPRFPKLPQPLFKPTRNRNPVAVGIVGILLFAIIGLLAYNADSLPVIGGGTTYTADFTEAAGLTADNEVRVAGVKVGKVTGVSLDGNRVKVTFRVKHVWIGNSSTAAISIKTLLGEKFLAVDPLGTAKQDPKQRIPVMRTTSPYDVTQAFNGLGENLGEIDTGQLAKSFQTISDTFKNTAPQVRTAANGLSLLSKTISSRDTKLAELLAGSKVLTQNVAAQNTKFQSLLNDGNLLLGELNSRRTAINGLLTGTRNLSVQLTGLIKDNNAQLKPTLDALDRVVGVLVQNKADLDRTLALAGPYFRLVGNTLGNGRWMDTYICGLVPNSYLPGRFVRAVQRLHAAQAGRRFLMDLIQRIRGLGARRLVAIGVALAVLVTAGTVTVLALGRSSGKHLTAYFDHTTGIYARSDLRVLGVKVGTINSVKPVGTKVKVTFTLNDGVRVPADADAVVVAPSVVSDRYIQLTPAYTGGPEIQDHAVLDVDRTATPLEVDQLYASITKLSDALGPNGANKNGALSDVLKTGAKNLKGNGKALGDTIEQLGKASKTLSGSSPDLFAALTYLESFTSMLKTNDSKVRLLDQQLSSVTGFLADDKDNLSGALSQLSGALNQVNAFIQENRGRISSSINSLVPVTQSLVDQRASLAETLDTAPLAIGNVLNAYDPRRGTINGRTDLNELSMGSKSTRSTTTQLAGILPLPSVGTVYGTSPKGAK